MKICVCCCTYKRPKNLGYLIHCFEQQTYPSREMVILDDAGQYENTEGDRWRLVSTDKRFPTLGDKRNAVADLATDADAYAVWDDDDLYFPWALAASVAALQNADWSRPSLVLHPDDRQDMSLPWTFRQHQTGGLYHGGWSFRRELFERAGKYPPLSGPEDQGLASRMQACHARTADPIQMGVKPFYIYGAPHTITIPNISRLGCDQSAYDRLGMFEAQKAAVKVQPPPWFDLDRPVIHGAVHPRPF